MGSTSYTTKLNTLDAMAAEADSQFNSRDGWKLICHNITRTHSHEWSHAGFFAVQTPDGNVTAFVMLATKCRDEFVHKILNEAEGPVATGASKKVLDALTATTNEYALTWRENARSVIDRRRAANRILNNAKKAGGAVVALCQPLVYGDPIGSITEVTISADGHWFSGGYRLGKPKNAWSYIAV